MSLSSGDIEVNPVTSVGITLLSWGGRASRGTATLNAQAVPSASLSSFFMPSSMTAVSCFFISVRVRTSIPAFLAFS